MKTLLFFTLCGFVIVTSVWCSNSNNNDQCTQLRNRLALKNFINQLALAVQQHASSYCQEANIAQLTKDQLTKEISEKWQTFLSANPKPNGIMLLKTSADAQKGIGAHILSFNPLVYQICEVHLATPEVAVISKLDIGDTEGPLDKLMNQSNNNNEQQKKHRNKKNKKK